MQRRINRKITAATILTFKIFFLFTSCASKEYDSPVAYNDSIFNSMEKITEASHKVTDALNLNNNKNAEKARKKFIVVIKEIKIKLEEYGDYNGSNTLKNAAKESCEFYEKTAKEDFKEMIRLNEEYQNDPSSVKIINQFNKLNTSIAERSGHNDKKLREAQQKFADEFSFTIL